MFNNAVLLCRYSINPQQDMNTLMTKCLEHTSGDDCYPLYIGFSSDTLFIIDETKKHAVEWILVGNDDDGYLAKAYSEDDFLDGIIEIKRLISSGVHPLTLFK